VSKHIEPEGGIASTPSTKRYLHERTRVIDPDPIFGPGPFSGGWVTSVFPVVGPPTWRRALTLALPQGDAGEASLDEPVDDVTLRRLRRVPFLVCFPCVLPRIPLLFLGFQYRHLGERGKSQHAFSIFERGSVAPVRSSIETQGSQISSRSISARRVDLGMGSKEAQEWGVMEPGGLNVERVLASRSGEGYRPCGTPSCRTAV